VVSDWLAAALAIGGLAAGWAEAGLAGAALGVPGRAFASSASVWILEPDGVPATAATGTEPTSVLAEAACGTAPAIAPKVPSPVTAAATAIETRDRLVATRG
jgi:hypothetical protein